MMTLDIRMGTRLARTLLNAAPSVIARAALGGLRAGLTIWREGHERVVRLAPAGHARGFALVAHVIAPFIGRRSPPAPAERRAWTAFALVDQLLARQLTVDVVSEQNTTFEPREPYSVFVATPRGFSRYADALPPDCTKVAHLEDPDILTLNAAELARLEALKERRGLVLRPFRVQRPMAALQQATCAIVQGNDATLDSYAHVKFPLYPVLAVAPTEAPSPIGKDVDAARRTFLWLGGHGLVHSGLDRVLEAFASAPEISLVVGGDVAAEGGSFKVAYARELYQTSNISTVGPVPLGDPRVHTLAQTTIGLVSVAGCEGQAADVVAGMAAGLIPIVTRESGVDIDDCGLMLVDDSPDSIRAAARAIVDLPALRLGQMASAAWQRASTYHGPSAVAHRYDEVFTEILGRPRSR